MSIEYVNKLTGDILNCENEIKSLEYKIELLGKEEASIDAKLDLEINRNKRATSRHYLSKEIVILILKEELELEKKKFAELMDKYIKQ